MILLTDTVAAERKKLALVPTADHVRRELRGLAEDLRPEDTLLVAFSGHGAHLKAGGLHFCPRGADLEKPATLVSMTEVYDALEKECRAGVKVLFVDACRNDPTDGRAAGTGRLASLTRPLVPDPPGGTVAFFSCSTGQMSYESDKLRHGVFFHRVIQGLKGGTEDDPVGRGGEVTVPLLEDYLTRAVPLAVKRDREDRSVRQVPERRGSLRGAVVLARGTAAGRVPPPQLEASGPAGFPKEEHVAALRGVVERAAGEMATAARAGASGPTAFTTEEREAAMRETVERAAAGMAAKRDAELRAESDKAAAKERAWRELGLALGRAASDDAVTRASDKLKGGLRIDGVRPDSPAAKAGLREGDILVGLHTWEVLSVENVTYVMNHADRASFRPLQFFVVRGAAVHRGTLDD